MMILSGHRRQAVERFFFSCSVSHGKIFDGMSANTRFHDDGASVVFFQITGGNTSTEAGAVLRYRSGAGTEVMEKHSASAKNI